MTLGLLFAQLLLKIKTVIMSKTVFVNSDLHMSQILIQEIRKEICE